MRSWGFFCVFFPLGGAGMGERWFCFFMSLVVLGFVFSFCIIGGFGGGGLEGR